MVRTSSRASRIWISSACRRSPRGSSNPSSCTARRPCPRRETRSRTPRGGALATRYGARLPQARGIPPELIRHAVQLGVAKVNTDSDLRLAALGRLRQVLAERPDLFNLYELMGEVERAIKDATAERIRLLDSAGRA